MFLQKAYIGKNRWYWYLLTTVIVLIATQIGSLPMVIYNIAKGSIFGDIPSEVPSELETIASTINTNTGLALALFSFAIGLGVLFLCVKLFQYKKPIDITTGRKRLDYKRFVFASIVWGGLMILLTMAEVIFDKDIVWNFNLWQFVPLVLVGLLLFPFQIGFEEVMFRGYFMQGIALIFKYRWVPIVLTSMMFGLMHSSNPEIEKFGFWTAMPQYILMGVILGYVAVKDDGLELALGMHFANNFFTSILLTSEGTVFQTASLFKDLSPSLSHIDTLAMMVCGIIFILICNSKYKFFGKINIWQKIQKPTVETAQMTEYENIN